MAFTLTMPEVGETVTEGTIERWLKQPGDHVDKYEPIVEVNTDKVNVEIPSPVSGTIKELLVEEGAVVEIGAQLAIIESADGETPAEAPPAPKGEAEEEPKQEAKAEEKEAEAEEKTEKAPAKSRGEAPSRRRAETRHADRRRATPRVRKVAEELGVNLDEVEGTGPQGRILEEDVRAFAESAEKAPAKAREKAPEEERPARKVEQDEEVVALSGVRRTIAQRMSASKFSAPHAWIMMEADVTGLVALRRAQREAFREREGVDLTYLPFVVAATVQCLREHPYLNASWGDDKIILKKRIHIGIAVAAEQGLLVPVVHDADRLSVSGLARAINEVTERARNGKLKLEDVQGGTFTVDNTGWFGSTMSMPIIAQGQAAILALEAIKKRPVVLDGDAIAVRSMVNLCLSFDHRILDGAQAGNFLRALVERMEAYGPDSPLT